MRWYLLLAIVLFGCSSAQNSAAPPMPAQAAEWTRTEPPEPAAPLAGARRAWQASYRGQPEIRLVLCEMPAPASAFEAVQKWRPSPGQLTFYKGVYFGLADAPGADQRTLNRFVNAVQEAMAQ